jgi:glycosyltransferase involved in cell wall biosynthesis
MQSGSSPRGKHSGRVLHLVTDALPSISAGYTIRTQEIALAQRAAGIDPHVSTRLGFPVTAGAIDGRATVTVHGVPYHRLLPWVMPGRMDRLYAAHLRHAARLTESLRPAVLHAASNYANAVIALALREATGLPVVYEVRGFWEDSWAASPWHDEATAMATDRYRMTRETETAAMLAADAVVTLSETMRQEIIGRGIPAERLTVVPNAVEIEDFEPVARDDAIAASLGVGRGEPVVGYISSLNAYEGIECLLEAASRLRSPDQKLRVLIVGEGDQERAIRETGRRLGLDDGTLIMPGRVPHDLILGYYALIDVFVVPRTANRVSRLVTPLKPFEAMALERALVVSDLPALREIVMPGETGMTFKAGDADDLARVLSDLLGDPALRARLGRQAREWVKAERTWAQNGRRYRELYERLGVA